jgi:hypothetical protein
MIAMPLKLMRHVVSSVMLSLLVAASLVFAQDQPVTAPPEAQQQPSNSRGTWRRFSSEPSQASAPSTASYSSSPNQGPQSNPSQAGNPLNAQANSSVPSRLIIKSSTFVTVRVNQTLSSDKNQPGDAFSATLARPLIVEGVVVAQRGQTVGGRVAEAQKAGRVKGVSRLGLELTDLTLVDGQQLPVQSELLGWTGPKSVGRDAAAVAGTTAAGAAIGAAAAWGTGAAIGAGAGALAGTVGVLLTRGRPTVVYPESMLTFRIDAPIAISTDRAPQAFRFAESGDYGQESATQPPPPPPPPSPCAGYGCPPPPPPYYYWPYPYPYYGPAFAFVYGPRFFYGPRFYGPRVGFWR